MENSSNALKIVFAILVFISALSILFFLISRITELSDKIFLYSDKTNYYINKNQIKKDNKNVVGCEDLIATINNARNTNTYVYIIENKEVKQLYPPLELEEEETKEERTEKLIKQIREDYAKKDTKFEKEEVEITNSGKYKYENDIAESGDNDGETRLTIQRGKTDVYITYKKI